jgi:YMGG-like Gly-zipper
MKQGIASILIATLLLGACATAPAPNQAKPTNIKEWIARQSRTRKGAIAGALIGALAGAANGLITGAHSDDVWKQALAGAVVGAIAGFAIGKHNDHIYAGRDLAVQEANYDSSQGYIARVEEVRFDPANAKPGETATLYVRYVVLGPDPNEAIRIRMFRGLKYGDDYVFGAGPSEFEVPKGGGIVESKMEVTLPKKAPEGTYAIEALVEDSKGRFPQVIGTGALYIVAQLEARSGVMTAAR